MRLFALALILTTAAAAAQNIHVRVDPNGPGSTASTTDYTTIQQALDHAPEAFEPQTFLRGSDNWNPLAEAAKLP